MHCKTKHQFFFLSHLLEMFFLVLYETMKQNREKRTINNF